MQIEIVRKNFERLVKVWRGFLLNIQIIFLYGFEAVQSQIIVRLTEHSDLPWLDLFTLIYHKHTKHRADFTSPVFKQLHHLYFVIIVTIISDLVISRSLVPFFVSFWVCC